VVAVANEGKTNKILLFCSGMYERLQKFLVRLKCRKHNSQLYKNANEQEEF